MTYFLSVVSQKIVNIDKKFIVFFFLSVFVLAIPGESHAYIGPGAGFAVVGSFLVMFTAMLSGLLALLTWPIRYIIRAIRGRHAFARSRVKKFVILGLDGMDAGLTQKFLDQGKLPNLSKLREQGCFKPLATTIPSMSPVAWSSFQTGVNPGKHNVFDFLTRDKRTYLPELGSVDIREPRQKINIGKYKFAIGKPDIRMLRKGKPFWKTLGENGIFSSVIRVPITFPPEKFHGVELSAMPVPDIRGTQGTFSFYTTQNQGGDVEHTGGEQHHVTRNGDTIEAMLIGPENPIRQDTSILKCPFMVNIIDDKSAEIKINGSNYKLEKDVYTEWIKINFKAGLGIKVRGICKFLLQSVEPEFKLYVTPINIDPEKPVMPISHPNIFSTYICKRQGDFATLGLAEDTWALNEKILSNDDFIQQCICMDEEREKMFFDSLDKVKRGLCVCVFDGTDRIQHTFWRDIDDEHPARREYEQEQNNVIEELYQRMDTLVGRAWDECKDKDTVFMVISDHGFNSFRYGVDLNRWLEENGYLKVKDGQRGKKHLSAIDWSETRAFAIGLAGIYLNLKGREANGIVEPGDEAAVLREEIAENLVKLKHKNKSEKSAIKNVYNAQKVFNGPYKDEAPDLIVGYNQGYRASWETAVGQVTEQIFHDNIKAWSGDHCIDPTLVPGVLFCNRSIDAENPRLMDIAPTVLEMFGVSVPKYIDGKPLTIS